MKFLIGRKGLSEKALSYLHTIGIAKEEANVLNTGVRSAATEAMVSCFARGPIMSHIYFL